MNRWVVVAEQWGYRGHEASSSVPARQRSHGIKEPWSLQEETWSILLLTLSPSISPWLFTFIFYSCIMLHHSIFTASTYFWPRTVLRMELHLMLLDIHNDCLWINIRCARCAHVVQRACSHFSHRPVQLELLNNVSSFCLPFELWAVFALAIHGIMAHGIPAFSCSAVSDSSSGIRLFWFHLSQASLFSCCFFLYHSISYHFLFSTASHPNPGVPRPCAVSAHSPHT